MATEAKVHGTGYGSSHDHETGASFTKLPTHGGTHSTYNHILHVCTYIVPAMISYMQILVHGGLELDVGKLFRTWLV